MARLPVSQAAELVAANTIPFGPRTHPCVCGAGKHAHSGKGNTGGSKATGCTRYRAHPAYQLAYKALDAQARSLSQSLREADRIERQAHTKANPRGEGEWSVGPSDAGTCRRRLWYRNTPPEGYRPLPTDNREAMMGTLIHEGVVRRLQVLYPWRTFEREVRVNGLDRPSFVDGYDPVTGEVEDTKTAGDWRWDRVTDHGVDDDVWEQVLLYGLALTEAGYTVRTVRINYIKRANGHDMTFVRDYDHEAACKARDRLLDIVTTLDLVADDPDADLDRLLPRDRSGPSTDPLCRRCEARAHCWNMDEAEALGRSPESYTVLGAEPLDPEVEWAILGVVEAREAEGEAKTRHKAAKALIDGLEPRRYGRAKIDTQTYGAGPDYKGYYEQVQQIAELPPEARPDLADIPVPYRRGKPQSVAKRVPANILEREQREADRLRAAAEQAAEREGGAA